MKVAINLQSALTQANVTLSAQYNNMKYPKSFVGYIPAHVINTLACCNYQQVESLLTYKPTNEQQITNSFIFNHLLLSSMLQEYTLMPLKNTFVGIDITNTDGVKHKFIGQANKPFVNPTGMEKYLYINNFTSMSCGYISTDMYFSNNMVSAVQQQGGNISLSNLMLNQNAVLRKTMFNRLAKMLANITQASSGMTMDLCDIVAFEEQTQNVVSDTDGITFNEDIMLIRPILNNQGTIYQVGAGTTNYNNLYSMNDRLLYYIATAKSILSRNSDETAGTFINRIQHDAGQQNEQVIRKQIQQNYTLDLSRFEVAKLSVCDKIIFELFLICLDICQMQSRMPIVMVDLGRYYNYAVQNPFQLPQKMTLLQNILPHFVEFIQSNSKGSIVIFTGVDVDNISVTRQLGSYLGTRFQ